MQNDKVIVSNFKALAGKYGSAGLTQIKNALKALVAKDKTEGLTTQVIDISNAVLMAKFRTKAVATVSNQKQVKTAIDAVYNTIVPAYIMILGSTDVVPHQELNNPVADPDAGDPDLLVPSDLPYACSAPYGKDPSKFVGPTRVVGRLPDLTGAKEPSYLLRVIEIAAKRQARTPQDYATHFGISAHEWQKSSELSLQRIFGSGKFLQSCPDKGPKWTAGQLAGMSHFINCHGSISRPIFHGQRGNSYPEAHLTSHITGKITDGTVAAVECCYGGLLYDPATAGGVMSICHAYLAGGAYGYCGSTTVAYGPEEGNAQADLICRYFLQRILAGSSLGRAMLEARQQFTQSAAQLDPFDLKTLMQFNLLGDPSIHPIARPSTRKPVGKSFAAAAASDVESRAISRADRRRVLIRNGEQIQQTQLVPAQGEKLSVAGALSKQLKDIARQTGIGDGQVLRFSIAPATEKPVAATRAKAAFAKLPAPETFYVMAKRSRGIDENDVTVSAVVAREVEGRIVDYRKVLSR